MEERLRLSGRMESEHERTFYHSRPSTGHMKLLTLPGHKMPFHSSLCLLLILHSDWGLPTPKRWRVPYVTCFSTKHRKCSINVYWMNSLFPQISLMTENPRFQNGSLSEGPRPELYYPAPGFSRPTLNLQSTVYQRADTGKDGPNSISVVFLST